VSRSSALAPLRAGLRRLLPWLVSGALLAYVFGWLTDWQRLVASIEQAHVPLFVAVTFADKLIFFVLWTFLQTTAIRRLVAPISVRSLLALRGGSELLRSVSNPLADAAFLMGLIRMTGGSPARVVLAASVPAIVHVIVLVGQVTAVLPWLEGGLAANREVAVAAGLGWVVILSAVLAIRLARRSTSRWLSRLRAMVQNLELRAFAPMLGWFGVLAFLDVGVQWLATHAFDTPLPVLGLAARIPILYAAFLLPAFGNFGTRELAWAALFEGHHPRDELIAYAFCTNALFLVFHVLIGVVFLPRALALLREVRQARWTGEALPKAPLARDPAEP